MKKIFIISYQPKEKSDKAEYVQTLINEFKKSGKDVRFLELNNIEIDFLKFNGNEAGTELTPELKEAQDNILWADQIVLIYSVWCLNVPAKVKAFVERVFQYGILVDSGNMGPKPLLKGKTLVLMQSYAMPYFYMKYFLGDVPYKFVKTVFETWCGFKIVKRFDIDMTENISEKSRQKFLKNIKNFAKK